MKNEIMLTVNKFQLSACCSCSVDINRFFIDYFTLQHNTTVNISLSHFVIWYWSHDWLSSVKIKFWFRLFWFIVFIVFCMILIFVFVLFSRLQRCDNHQTYLIARLRLRLWSDQCSQSVTRTTHQPGGCHHQHQVHHSGLGAPRVQPGHHHWLLRLLSTGGFREVRYFITIIHEN